MGTPRLQARPVAGLHQADAELVLVGHDHVYQRFAPQSATGVADPTGIREFVVGTGGKTLYGFMTPKPNSQVRTSTFGVLFLTAASLEP
jgi:hypothetical protein